jgi:hypothetical protein
LCILICIKIHASIDFATHSGLIRQGPFFLRHH